MTRYISMFLLVILLSPISLSSRGAGFGINSTRLIYPEGANSIHVTVRNTLNDVPYLVQALISSKQDVHTSAPFALTPPLFRLEPQSTNQLNITFTGAALPDDRESIFYFHATAIPTSKQLNSAEMSNDIGAQLRFGVGSIIKLFYRPANLSCTSAEAQGGLQFSRVTEGIKVSNPSPYFVNLVSLKVGEQKLAMDTPAAMMLAPFDSHTWSIKTRLAGDHPVQWQTINDTGGIDVFNATLP